MRALTSAWSHSFHLKLTVKVSVGLVFDEGSTPEVNQLQAQRLQVDQEVLVLKIVTIIDQEYSEICNIYIDQEYSERLFEIFNTDKIVSLVSTTV